MLILFVLRCDTGYLIKVQQVVNVGRTMATVAASHVDLVLNVDNINPNLKAMEYAVRGYIFILFWLIFNYIFNCFFLFSYSIDLSLFELEKLRRS